MKICAIICEYNPFHNGHLHQLQLARSLSGADAVLCLMSGNFVQRGEAAILDKYTRARHAVLAGADAVLELPTPFATANAELFAKGAVKLLSSIPSVTTLCFGAETADREAFYKAARLLNDEPREISLSIKELTSRGMGYAKARAVAWAERIDEKLLSSPNNILGLEYTKALLALRSPIEILPVQRIGGGYADRSLQENYSSATAIREALAQGEDPSENLPSYVASNLPKRIENVSDTLQKYAIISKSEREIARVCDCTEGLENALKKAALLPEPLVKTLTSARYTSSRIRRIALQNLLNVDEALIRESLCSPLYLRILAIKKARKDLLTEIAKSIYPVLIRGKDENLLGGIARQCSEADAYAESVYALLYPQAVKNKTVFI